MAGAAAIGSNSLALTVPGQGHDIAPGVRAMRDPAHPIVHRPGRRDRPRHHLPGKLAPTAFDLTFPNN
jgi:hypothetical protein